MIGNDARHSVGVDRSVVPGWYAQFDLVPRWRDVGMRSLEDHQHLALRLKGAPLGIAQGHMGSEDSVGGRLWFVQKWQRRGDRHAILLRADQGGKTILAHHGLEDAEIIFTEVLRNIHALPRNQNSANVLYCTSYPGVFQKHNGQFCNCKSHVL